MQENFIRPYFSKNIAEFWRRWHITMGTWFRDYIFYPMSIAPWMRTLTRKAKDRFGKGFARRVPVWLATMVTWFATGLWHGASWNYITWGVLNGVILLLSEELEPAYARFHARFPKLTGTAGYRAFMVLRTFLLMSALRIFDCYEDVGTSFRMFFGMFTRFQISDLNAAEFADLDLPAVSYTVVFFGVVLMFLVSMLQRKGDVRRQLSAKPYIVRYSVFLFLFLAVLVFGTYGVGYDATQFIYNRF